MNHLFGISVPTCTQHRQDMYSLASEEFPLFAVERGFVMTADDLSPPVLLSPICDYASNVRSVSGRQVVRHRPKVNDGPAHVTDSKG